MLVQQVVGIPKIVFYTEAPPALPRQPISRQRCQQNFPQPWNRAFSLPRSTHQLQGQGSTVDSSSTNCLSEGMFPLYSNLNTSNSPVAGRLAYFIQNCCLTTNDPWVCQTITGYHIEFTQTPVQEVLLPLLPFSEEETLAMDNEIKSLQGKGAIHKAPMSDKEPGFVSSLFMVPKKGRGQRPVINLKALNNFVEYSHFKMEGINMLRDVLRKDDYMVKLDLRDAYFTVPVWINHQKYLRFLWKDTMWEFACLPYGLASAPRVFTKIMKPLSCCAKWV